MTSGYRFLVPGLSGLRSASWNFTRDKVALKRTGILQPAKLYGRTLDQIDPAFDLAM